MSSIPPELIEIATREALGFLTDWLRTRKRGNIIIDKDEMRKALRARLAKAMEGLETPAERDAKGQASVKTG